MTRSTDPDKLGETRRKQRLAQIHMGKKALGLGEREYRGLLVRASADEHGLGGYDSATHMSEAQHLAVIREMSRLGFKSVRVAAYKRRRWPGEPKDCDARPMLLKVRALLTHSRKPWSYAHSMAAHMFDGVKRVEWLNDVQLHKLIAALEIDARRHSR